ncbi:extracellular solute-binding protein [Anaerolineales bacterium HSG24]|nr:extracellular solute-binding protein [Anaerolineales bacterium HSG24]
MLKLFSRILMITIVTTLLASCQNIIPLLEQDSDELRGNILIWHAWEDNEAQVLDEILDEFTDTHPNVTIIRRALTADVIIDEYSRLSASGLGPDILIAPADQAGDLAQAGLIQNLQSYTIDPDASLDEDMPQDYKIDLDIYLAAAMDMLRDRDEFYGLPLSLNTTVLYYNKELLNQFSDKAVEVAAEAATELETEIEQSLEGEGEGEDEAEIEPTPTPTPEPIETIVTPAETLQELWEHANQGHQIAFPIGFHSSSWGIQAFGGNLFDEEGRIVLNQGGFANWLGWLKRLQDIPTVIFNTDHGVLTELFTDGRVTYYIGNSNELSTLQEALGEEVVGTIRLPARQNKPAGPFLQAEVMMFNKASSPKDTELALRLARFLTNIDQQRELALETGELPVHKRVRIDPRVSLVVSEMIAQSRTSVPITLDNIPKLRDLEESGDELYQQVLSGEIAGGGAATLLTQEINTKYGFEALPTAEEFACVAGDTIEVWHSWPQIERAILDEIKDNYLNLCPNSTIRIIATETDEELYRKYSEAALDKQGPDLIIATNQWIPSLTTDGLVQNIDDMMDPEFLQRYIPQVEQSMRYDGDLHGLPVSIDLMGLYYNTDRVKDPPVVLDDLLVVASPETKVAFPIGFYESYWGISAFGESSDSPIFDEENRLILGEVGLSDWLAWLKVAKEEQGFVFSENLEELKTMFLDESAAYLIGEASLLSELQTTLGEDKIGVVPLPAGGPLLLVENMMLNSNSDENKSALALHFAQYVTSAENQTLLLEKANKIPANVNVSVTSPAIAGFVEQANASVVIPNKTEVVAVFQWGNQVYQQVLDGNIDPARATQDFTTLVNLVNGFDVTSEETLAEYADCTDEGQVLLWHSWSGFEIAAWQTIINNFAELCPGIQLQTQHVPADKLADELFALIKAPTLTDTVEMTTTLETPVTTLETSTATTDTVDTVDTVDTIEATPVTTETNRLPDFFMASHDLIIPLLEAELLADLTPLMDETALINYIPEAVVAIQHQEKVYGIPQSLNTMALYYNKNLVEEPVSTLDELLRSATPTKQVALNPLFYESFWGASALGCEPCQNEQMFDEQGNIIVTSNDFSDWANWLENAQDKSGFILSADQKELEEQFVAGEVAYLIAGPHALSTLQNALGFANVGVTTLPEGETGVAKPFLQVESFLFNNKSNEDQKALALKFVKFANLQKQQTLLLQEGNFIPTNKLTTAINDDASVDKFVRQVGSSILAPDVQNMKLLETTSGITYTIVTTTTVTTTTNN